MFKPFLSHVQFNIPLLVSTAPQYSIVIIIVFQPAFYSNEMFHLMIKVPTVYPPFLSMQITPFLEKIIPLHPWAR